MGGTKCSDYLGLKHYKKAKKEKTLQPFSCHFQILLAISEIQLTLPYVLYVLYDLDLNNQKILCLPSIYQFERTGTNLNHPTVHSKLWSFSIIPHCLDLDLNGLLTRRNFWHIPGMLGNYTIPKWKEFLKTCHYAY